MIFRTFLTTFIAAMTLGVVNMNATGRTDLHSYVIASVVGSGIVVFALVMAILVHELGHVVSGRLAGFKFVSLLVGNLGIRAKAEGGLAFYWVTKSFAGGIAAMDMAPGDNLRIRFRRMVRGGPVASILWCFFTFALFVASSPPQGAQLSFLAFIGYWIPPILFLMSVVILPGAFWPKPVRGMLTDIFLLRRLRHDGPETDRLIAIFQTTHSIRLGLRARDWSPALIESAGRLRDGGVEEMQARILAYYHFSDRGSFDRAQNELDRANEILPRKEVDRGPTGQSIVYAKAFTHARANEPVEARAVFESVKQPLDLLDSSRQKALAAVLLSEGRAAEAVSAVEASHKALTKLSGIFPGDVTADREILDSLEREAEAKAF
ncbi:M50 family peptidase [bacterium]|nr:MAG: M50 family peptidase [bacterium]